MKAEERICCQGHVNITALHPTTFEVTTGGDLTLAGDCIIGVWADKGAADLSARFREVLVTPESLLVTTLRCGRFEVEVWSAGGPGLCLTHPHDLVWRRSSFCCGRTIGINSSHAARTIDRGFVDLLRKGEEMEIIMEAYAP